MQPQAPHRPMDRWKALPSSRSPTIGLPPPGSSDKFMPAMSAVIAVPTSLGVFTYPWILQTLHHGLPVLLCSSTGTIVPVDLYLYHAMG